MKTLSVQQPWASLICSGIKDVENRSWATNYRGKLLIHASGKKVPKNFLDTLSIEVCNDVANNITFGNMERLDELPTGAIIGFVELTGCVTEFTKSIYDGGDDCIKWTMENAYMFDEPIMGVKGKLGLFEYPLDENELPSYHKVELRKPYVDGTNLKVGISDSEFDNIEALAGEPKEFLMCFDETDPDMCDLFKSDDDYEFVNITKVTFIAKDGRTVSFDNPDLSVIEQQDENGDPITGLSLYGDGEEEAMLSICVRFE